MKNAVFASFALVALAACGARSEEAADPKTPALIAPTTPAAIADNDPRFTGGGFEPCNACGSATYVRLYNANLSLRHDAGKLLLAAGACSYVYDGGPKADDQSATGDAKTYNEGVQMVFCGGSGAYDEAVYFKKGAGGVPVFCDRPTIKGSRFVRCVESPMPGGAQG